MTTEHPEKDGEDSSVRRGTVVSEDGSVSSSSSGEDASSDGDKVRREARELLARSHDRGGTRKGGDAAAPGRTGGYASYHDAPDVQPSSASPFSGRSSGAPAANPPWASGGRTETDDVSLTAGGVAALAFSCVARCLTEGYRAASSYYGYGDDDSRAQRVGGYGDLSYGNVSSSNYNDSGDGSFQQKGYYSDSYQAKGNNPSGHGEVMDRGLQQGAGRSSGPGIKEEWATVPVPSSYQGGGVGSGK